MDLLLKQQGLEAYKGKLYDDLTHRTFGGILRGEGFVSAGTGEGKYAITPYRSWMLKSSKATKAHRLQLVSHIEQSANVAD
ncbi:DUF5703 domain-containing protein [Pirellulales bacterium]|nr:DUF5703 domain-containing protein [Pirellulales bacterium]